MTLFSAPTGSLRVDRSAVDVCAVELGLAIHDRAHRSVAGGAAHGAGEVEAFLDAPEVEAFLDAPEVVVSIGGNRVAGSPAAIQPIGTAVPGASRELTCRTELMRSSQPMPATAPGTGRRRWR